MVLSVKDLLGQPYDTVRVGYNTSVNLIFDSSVKMWDMGLGLKIEEGNEVWDVLVENPSESRNRIKLAAGVENFETTNLFIETEFAYYNFILAFDANPVDLLIKVDGQRASILKGQVKTISEERMEVISSNDSLAQLCEHILMMKNNHAEIGEVRQKMLFYLSGIYVSGPHVFFQVNIKNEGNIKFDLGYVGFFTGNRTKGKKKARQDEMISPVYVHNSEITDIETRDTLTQVYVFKKFTLDRKKKLYIQFWEGNGGERKVELVVRSGDILNAVTVFEL